MMPSTHKFRMKRDKNKLVNGGSWANSNAYKTE